jgi:conjugal transfer mating pair stabilization protein TraG
VADQQLRTDLIAFVHNCTLYDLQDRTIDPATFAQSTDIWALMGTPNPGRFSTFGNPVQVDIHRRIRGKRGSCWRIRRDRRALARRVNTRGQY